MYEVLPRTIQPSLMPSSWWFPLTQVKLPMWVEESPVFQEPLRLPDQALPVDIASEVSKATTDGAHWWGR